MIKQQLLDRGGWVLAGLALAIVFMTGGERIAASAPAAARPAPPEPVAVVVDMNSVLQGLDERKAKEETFKARFDQARSELQGLVDELENQRSLLAAAKAEDKPAIEERITTLNAQIKATDEASARTLTRLESEILSDMFAKIRAAAGEVAQRSGYTLVLSTDEHIDLPTGLSPTEVNRAATMRRILYSDKSHDISQELIDFMNNKFAAGM